MAGAEDRFNSGQSAATKASRGFPFGEEFDCAGVKPEVDIGVGGEGLVVETGEVWFRAPA